jgi:hypothetical protein
MEYAATVRRKKSDRKEREKMLDEAIEMSFPASDPIAVGRPSSTEEQQGRPVNAKARTSKRNIGMRPIRYLGEPGVRARHLDTLS